MFEYNFNTYALHIIPVWYLMNTKVEMMKLIIQNNNSIFLALLWILLKIFLLFTSMRQQSSTFIGQKSFSLVELLHLQYLVLMLQLLKSSKQVEVKYSFTSLVILFHRIIGNVLMLFKQFCFLTYNVKNSLLDVMIPNLLILFHGYVC